MSDKWLRLYITVTVPIIMLLIIIWAWNSAKYREETEKFRAEAEKTNELIVEKLLVKPEDVREGVFRRLDEISARHVAYVNQARTITDQDIILLVLLIRGPEFTSPEQMQTTIEFIKKYREQQ